MKIIVHRRNLRAELDSTDTRFGVEVDLRSNGNQLVAAHDPFFEGEDFGFWIEGLNHSTLIVNVKEEGLENRVLSVLKDRGIEDFFLLDQSFPSLVKCALAGEGRTAVRVSEFESIETALLLSGKVRWVWLDSFGEFLFSETEVTRLVSAGFQICVVSPELQGRDADFEVPALLQQFGQWGIELDAVCTKRPDLWERVGAY